MIKRSVIRGFTLVEVLIAMAIFGLVMTGMYKVYSSVQKTTINQSELVDVQQNLRVAIGLISRDIKMANALIPAGSSGITVGSNAATLNLATVSSLYAYAQISEDLEIPGGGATGVFKISVPTVIDYFTSGNLNSPNAGDRVRIVRPQNGNQPFDALPNHELYVSAKDRTVPSLTVSNFTNAAAVQYKAGDIIARVGIGAPDPSTIVWNLSGTDLQRNRDAVGADVIAENISNLTFGYLLKNGTETAAPTVAELDNIRAVRVTLAADTARQFDGQTRQRSLSSIVYLRN